MICVCGATRDGHCPFCRSVANIPTIEWGPVKFAGDSLLVLVGAPGCGKTTMACSIARDLGGAVYGNELSDYATWGLATVKRIPVTGNIVIDSCQSMGIKKMGRRGGVTLAINRLNAQGGLYEGVGLYYDSDVLISLERADNGGTVANIIKSRYGQAGEKYPFSIEYPRIIWG